MPALNSIKSELRKLALDSGFQDMRVSDTCTNAYFEKFKAWVENKLHGDMSFLERNQELRQNPELLHPNTCRVISLRYNYLPESAGFSSALAEPKSANISRYALGRDYHKILRKKLSQLMQNIQANSQINEAIDYRVFVDSAPVLETAFAEKSGLGWKGKHSLIINKEAGSWFFLAEIFINLPLPLDNPVEDQCGECSACIALCPTQAILAHKTIDANRCISYLTIENKGAIPRELRASMGNRIYGCDDCQLACPWNRYSSVSEDDSFYSKNGLNKAKLSELWALTETEFLKRFEGSPIRRIGYQSWLRNLAVAIGNSGDFQMIRALTEKKADANEMVKEHICWAIEQIKLNEKRSEQLMNKKTLKLIRCVNTMHSRDA